MLKEEPFQIYLMQALYNFLFRHTLCNTRVALTFTSEVSLTDRVYGHLRMTRFDKIVACKYAWIIVTRGIRNVRA